MERIAVIQITETKTKLLIMDSRACKYIGLKEYEDEFPIGEEIITDKLLKPKTVSKIVSVLTIYREIIQSYGVTKIFGVATKTLLKARNQKGFFEEVYNNTGVVFTMLSDEECIKNIFTAVNSKIDVSKAYGVYVDLHSSYVVRYNRRTMLDFFVLPYGVENLTFENKSYAEMLEIMKAEVEKNKTFDIDPNEICITMGDPFINFGRIAKKLDHYPIDIDNNYNISNKLANDCFAFVKGLDLEKIKKVKSMIGTPSSFLAGIAIIEALFKTLNINDIVVSDANILDGVVIGAASGDNQEKFTDLLGNSFENYFELRKNDFSNNIRVANMAGILFKQLKVMHKLPRAYVKPMRVAAYMYDCGKSVNFESYEKYGLYTILNSGLCGVSQKDLLLAGFICMCQNPDNFSLAEWMKYKDIVTDEDLDAVRKLGVIVKLAAALNSTKKEVVNDVVCDILGDSIIMKTVVNGDPTYEIMQGMKVASDYRKIFKKNLQII